MGRKGFAGWLFVSLLPLFAFVCIAIAHHQAPVVHGPIANDQFSAELARTVSYGFFDQPVDQALDGASRGDVAAPNTAAVSQHSVFRQANGLAVGAAVLKRS